MLIAFMSFRKFLYLQTIVAENELSAQRTVLSLDSEMFFKAPVAGLEQPRRRKKKRPPYECVKLFDHGSLARERGELLVQRCAAFSMRQSSRPAWFSGVGERRGRA